MRLRDATSAANSSAQRLATPSLRSRPECRILRKGWPGSTTSASASRGPAGQVRGAHATRAIGRCLTGCIARPTSGKLPLVLYLSGSGGLGDDNLKQIGLGNIFGTRVWLLARESKAVPLLRCCPADRSWMGQIRFHPAGQRRSKDPSRASAMGRGWRSRSSTACAANFLIDERRIYVAGQSMGGAGAWNVIAARPALLCSRRSLLRKPFDRERDRGHWHTAMGLSMGDDDKSVPVSLSRERDCGPAQGRRTPALHRVCGG